MPTKKSATKPSATPPTQDVLKFWTRYVSSFRRRPDQDIFLNKLRTCEDLVWLCEPGLGDPRFQHGTVYALLELWEDAHRDQKEAQWPEHLQHKPPRRKRGRRVEFPAPYHLQGFLLGIQQVFARKGSPPARYRMYGAKILSHFFPDLLPPVVDSKEAKNEVAALRERQRGRALIYKRKHPEDAKMLAQYTANEATGIVETYREAHPEWFS